MAGTRRLAIQITREHFRRWTREMLHESGALRVLVADAIRQGEDPSSADVAAALREPLPRADDGALHKIDWTAEELGVQKTAMLGGAQPVGGLRAWQQQQITPERRRKLIASKQARIDADTSVIMAYVATTYVLGTPRRTGPKAAARSLRKELTIARAYHVALQRAKLAHEHDSRQPRQDVLVKRRVAERFGIGIRTLEGILRTVRAKVY